MYLEKDFPIRSTLLYSVGMTVEGIIIHKTPYKERDIIAKLLLRNGKVLNLYFYGGRGGGKNQKGSVLELGYMLKVVMAPRRKKLEQDIHIAKEWAVVWEPGKIRSDFRSFYLLTFIFELTGKVTVQHSLNEHFDDDHQEGIFKVVSNSLFFINKSLEDNNFNVFNQFFIMLNKLIFELGVLPDFESCQFCHIDLAKVDLMNFEASNGGFVCRDCLLQKDQIISDDKFLFQDLQNAKALRERIKQSIHLKYKDYGELEDIERGQIEALISYICYQLGFSRDKFQSLPMLFS